MDIFEKVEDISRKGYSIEYVMVDQIANGCEERVKQGLIPAVTYTVYVMRLSDGEQLYAESSDHIQDGLVEGIRFAEKLLA